MPADGNCFYHALSHRLATLGHNYSVFALKRIAGARHGEEAEEQHIKVLVSKPVPLRIKFVPVNAADNTLVLNWDAALYLGDPASPPLTLVRWTINGAGKHFDILEFTRNNDVVVRNPRSNNSSATQLIAATKRKGNKIDPMRKMFKLVDGKIIRISDNRVCTKDAQHDNGNEHAKAAS